MLEVAVALVAVFGLSLWLGNSEVTAKDDADTVVCVGVCMHTTADHVTRDTPEE